MRSGPRPCGTVRAIPGCGRSAGSSAGDVGIVVPVVGPVGPVAMYLSERE